MPTSSHATFASPYTARSAMSAWQRCEQPRRLVSIHDVGVGIDADRGPIHPVPGASGQRIHSFLDEAGLPTDLDHRVPVPVLHRQVDVRMCTVGDDQACPLRHVTALTPGKAGHLVAPSQGLSCRYATQPRRPTQHQNLHARSHAPAPAHSTNGSLSGEQPHTRLEDQRRARRSANHRPPVSQSPILERSHATSR